MSLNRVMMIGNLGQDPEIRHPPSGLPLVNFSLATDEPYVDKERGNAGSGSNGTGSWPPENLRWPVTSI
ncbi:MAG: single-stranded DNA-binding protein [Deltaproteobacteria bacterium]|nr:single-stranded DNA-binding protein [Deltaproteobacteria bacterium]